MHLWRTPLSFVKPASASRLTCCCKPQDWQQPAADGYRLPHPGFQPPAYRAPPPGRAPYSQAPCRQDGPRSGSGPRQPGAPHPAEINKQITATTSCATILQIAVDQGKFFDAVNVATSLHRLAKNKPPQTQPVLEHAGFRHILMMTDSNLSSFQPQQLANILWAFGTLEFRPGADLLERMASAAQTRSGGFNPQNLSNTLWAFAKLEHNPGKALLDEFARRIQGALTQFTPQNVSNMLWAFARLGHFPGKALLDDAAEYSTSGLAKFSPQVSCPAAALACTSACHSVSVVVEPKGNDVLHLYWHKAVHHAICCFTRAACLPSPPCPCHCAGAGSHRSLTYCRLSRTACGPLPHWSTALPQTSWRHRSPTASACCRASPRRMLPMPCGRTASSAFSLTRACLRLWMSRCVISWGMGQQHARAWALLTGSNSANGGGTQISSPFLPFSACQPACHPKHAVHVMQVVTKGHQYQPQNMSNIAWAFASWGHFPSDAMSSVMEQHLLNNLKEYSAQVSFACRMLLLEMDS